MKSLLALLGPPILILASSGCLLRGDVELVIAHPTTETWTPSALLEAAVASVDGDLNATMVRSFTATFDESGILRILDLKIRTERLSGGEPFYLDFLVGTEYDSAADVVRFRGFTHEDLDINDRPNPAREWTLTPGILAALDLFTYAKLADPANDSSEATLVLEVRLMPDCAPHATGNGDWEVWHADASGLVSAGADQELRCFTMPHLPPTALVVRHMPCIEGPGCPESETESLLVDFGAGD